MLSGSVTGLGAINEALARLRRLREVDVRPLAERIARIIEDDHRAGMLAGTDADGEPFAPLAESTRKHRDGAGPPGSPGGPASALVAGFRVEVTASGDGFELSAGWSGEAATKARFFSEGTAHQPPRNLVGVRPGTWTKIQGALDEFARDVAGG